MGEAKRRKLDGEPRRFVNIEHAVTQFADSVLHGGGDVPTVAIGPLVWGIEQGHDAKHWYFVVGSADAAGKFHADQLKIANDDKPLARKPAQPWCRSWGAPLRTPLSSTTLL
jgi:hypothetical protein